MNIKHFHSFDVLSHLYGRWKKKASIHYEVDNFEICAQSNSKQKKTVHLQGKSRAINYFKYSEASN